jgi:hypothetical protein
VLVVEDNIHMRALIRPGLFALGCKTVVESVDHRIGGTVAEVLVMLVNQKPAEINALEINAQSLGV